MFIGELSALAAALLWSCSSFVFTAATFRIGTIQLNISRMIIASLLLVITLMILGIRFEISEEQLIYLSLSGFVGLVIGDSFLFKAFNLVGPRISLLLLSFNPAFAAIFAFFLLGEVLSFFAIIGMIITLLGITIVVLEKHSNESKFKVTKFGIFCGFMSAIGQGVGLVLAKMAFQNGDIHYLVATFIRIASAVVIMLPFALLFKKYSNPFKVFSEDKKALGLVSLGAVIGPYLGITLSFIAIIYTHVGIASTLMSTMPIIMLPMSKIIYKEKLSIKAVVGAFIAVTGVAILFLL
ncbi:DMT family transporter [Bacteroidetes/Chlorobi group bacterium ChocPot_Mid]|nr:MAG: DMT family transporter [Bacteroidetes/Chlorobi group bacterium ChocPot_Mid]